MNLAALFDEYTSMSNQRLEQLTYARALRASPLGWLEIIEPARPAEIPFMPQPRRYATIAFLAMAFVAYGAYFFFQVLNTRIKTVEEVERATGLPVLAEFGIRHGAIVDSPSIGYLRASIESTLAGPEAIVIVVTGPEPSSAQSKFSLELAAVCAQDGHRTLLVDADFDQHQLTTLLKIQPGTVRPLAEYLTDVTPPVQPVASVLGGKRRVAVAPIMDSTCHALSVCADALGKPWIDQARVRRVGRGRRRPSRRPRTRAGSGGPRSVSSWWRTFGRSRRRHATGRRSGVPYRNEADGLYADGHAFSRAHATVGSTAVTPDVGG